MKAKWKQTLTKSPEEAPTEQQQEINKNWEEKLAPCTKKMEESMTFEKEVQDCLTLACDCAEMSKERIEGRKH